MNPELLAKALAAMVEGTTTREKFHAMSGIASRAVADRVADFICERGLGKASGRTIAFSSRDRLAAAAVAIGAGCDVEQVSQHLSWKDFEGLASEVLASLGYATKTNVRFTKPRMEIDVLGVDGTGFALAVDCKHWRRGGSTSSISSFCAKQAARAKEVVRRNPGIAVAVPAILTLHAEQTRFVGGIPVVPVLQFRSFAMDVKGHLDEIYSVVRQEPA